MWVGFADINNDSIVDIVAASSGTPGEGRQEVYYGDGTSFPTTPSWESDNEGWNTGASLGDIDEDGYLDLAVAQMMAGTYTARIYFGDSDSFLPYSWTTAHSDQGLYTQFCDVDNNGKIDLIVSNSNLTGYCIHLDSANTIARNYVQLCGGWVDYPGCISVGDANNDGWPEFAASDWMYGAQVGVWENTGGTFSLGWQQSGGSCVAWGDVNRDCVIEVVDTLIGNDTLRLFYLKHYPIHEIDSVKVGVIVLEPHEALVCYGLQNGWIQTLHAPPSSPAYFVYYKYCPQLDLAVEVSGSPDKVYYNTLPRVEESISFNKVVLQSVPNPFYKFTRINFYIPNTASGVIRIYDIMGSLVREFDVGKGENYIIWDGENAYGKEVPGGIYFCTLKVNNKVITKKLIKMQ